MIGPPTEVIIDRVLRGQLRPLVVNLYSARLVGGYSLVFPSSAGDASSKFTTRCFSYETELELLDDIENCRLPLFLIDLIDRYCTDTTSTTTTIFYRGCIGVEIRDFRKSENDRKYDLSYTVLRPTLATLLNDLENLRYESSMMINHSSSSSLSTERGEEASSMMMISTTKKKEETANEIFARRSEEDQRLLTLESDFWRLIGSSSCRNYRSPPPPPLPGNIEDDDDRRKKLLLLRPFRYDVQARRKRERQLVFRRYFPIMGWITKKITSDNDDDDDDGSIRQRPSSCSFGLAAASVVAANRSADHHQSSSSSANKSIVAATAPASSISSGQQQQIISSSWKPMMPSMVRTPMEIAEKRAQRAQIQLQLQQLQHHTMITDQEQQQQREEEGMELWEEYLVEVPSIKYKTKTRIRIYRRCQDAVYVGELRMERVENNNGGEQQQQQQQSEDGGEDATAAAVAATSASSDTTSECRFLLGTEAGARSYIRQYLDMVSESGRRPITLTRRVPGRLPLTMPPPAILRSSTAAVGVSNMAPRPPSPAAAPMVTPIHQEAPTTTTTIQHFVPLG